MRTVMPDFSVSVFWELFSYLNMETQSSIVFVCAFHILDFVPFGDLLSSDFTVISLKL
jgi:hypothetical protein